MELGLDEAAIAWESRTAGIQMVLWTLRTMEHWREAAGNYNSAMILMAIVAISSEKLTRIALPTEYRALKNAVHDEALTPCNISSIAAASGFNRETARRYANQLIDDGILTRTEGGSIRFVEGFVRRQANWRCWGFSSALLHGPQTSFSASVCLSLGWNVRSNLCATSIA